MIIRLYFPFLFSVGKTKETNKWKMKRISQWFFFVSILTHCYIPILFRFRFFKISPCIKIFSNKKKIINDYNTRWNLNHFAYFQASGKWIFSLFLAFFLPMKKKISIYDRNHCIFHKINSWEKNLFMKKKKIISSMLVSKNWNFFFDFVRITERNP